MVNYEMEVLFCFPKNNMCVVKLDSRYPLISIAVNRFYLPTLYLLIYPKSPLTHFQTVCYLILSRALNQCFSLTAVFLDVNLTIHQSFKPEDSISTLLLWYDFISVNIFIFTSNRFILTKISFSVLSCHCLCRKYKNRVCPMFLFCCSIPKFKYSLYSLLI